MRKSVILILLTAAVLAQATPRRSDNINLRTPLDIPLILSGNFGELRRNHFHSGVDFKTQGRTGFPVYAVDDGYVSRASVSPWGFGRAVYVTHPSTGLTTVYGHLEAFSPAIDKIVRNKQYEEQTFSIDVSFKPDEIPVKRGDIIARSGNAGSSGGPHLHFDVRDTQSQDPLDPMEYFRKQITDRTPPEVRQLALYPYQAGVVEGSSENGAYRQPGTQVVFTAWGDVVPGIKAYDRMTGTTNIYGVKYLTLVMDGDTIYRRTIDRYSFDNTKAVHTIINNADLVNNSSWIMTTRVPDSQPLGSMILTRNNGVVNINSEKTYNFTWILEDEHGNKTRQNFKIKGVRTPVPAPVANGQLLLWDENNLVEADDVYIEIPENTLYENTFINVGKQRADSYFSDLVTIGDETVPLARNFDITLPLTSDTLADKSKYVLVRLKGGKRTAVKTNYSDGYVSASVPGFGTYGVTSDLTPPVIKPLNKEKWKASKTVKFKITDNLSGVDSWVGKIDGKWALFELDGKTATLWFKIDPERFPGSTHNVDLTVTDASGNTAVYKSSF